MNPTLLADVAGDADATHMMWGAWMWLPALVVVLVALAALIWFARNANSGGRRRAEDILADRFARGELTADEYHERREALQ